MISILRALLKVSNEEEETWHLVDDWIRCQARLASQTELDTNVALYLLEALLKEYEAWPTEFRNLDIASRTDELGSLNELTFVASSRDVLIARQILSRQKGFRLPFANALQLAARLSNEQAGRLALGEREDRPRYLPLSVHEEA